MTVTMNNSTQSCAICKAAPGDYHAGYCRRNTVADAGTGLHKCDIHGFDMWQCTASCKQSEVKVVSTVEQITAARGPVYGPFLHNAIVAQNIKAAFQSAPPRPDRLPADVQEALDLIALKISRIVTGDPEYLDNWDDIGGYAKIVADRIRNKGVTKC